MGELLRMPPPLAYLLTWTTYGSWLPGDKRGWVDGRYGAWHVPYEERDPDREMRARSRMTGSAVMLTPEQRGLVEAKIQSECDERCWCLHALSARSNHVHVVMSVGDIEPGKILGMLKMACTSGLNAECDSPRRWWTKNGSRRFLNDERSLHGAIRYVLNQDVTWLKEP